MSKSATGQTPDANNATPGDLYPDEVPAEPAPEDSETVCMTVVLLNEDAVRCEQLFGHYFESLHEIAGEFGPITWGDNIRVIRTDQKPAHLPQAQEPQWIHMNENEIWHGDVLEVRVHGAKFNEVSAIVRLLNRTPATPPHNAGLRELHGAELRMVKAVKALIDYCCDNDDGTFQIEMPDEESSKLLFAIFKEYGDVEVAARAAVGGER